jgi:GT2 family glycosyltransferase
MVKLLLPYVKETENLKLARELLKKFTPPEVEIVEIHDKERNGMTVVFNEYFTGEDDLIVWHSDMYATEGWYERLMSFYDKFDVIGTKLVYPDGIIQHYGGFIKKGGIGFHPHQGCLNLGLDEPISCPFVTWGGTLIKKEVIKKVGKMDEQFFQSYYGDVDYCLRAIQADFKVGVVPVQIVHQESADNMRNPNLSKIMAENHAIFVAKWLPALGEL